MNKTIRVVVAVIVTSLLTTASFADDGEENVARRYEVFPDPPNEGILFVDHARTGRSGHLGHALVEYEDGKILAFYPSCSSDSHNPNKPASKGHSAVGWMEYKRSEDGGKTWSAPHVLAYSKDLFDAGQNGGPDAKKYSAFAEKAVVTNGGRIVVFFLVCDITTNVIWRQFQIPKYIISSDGGYTWSEPAGFCTDRGRIYDAKYYNGEILALNFKNDNEINFLGNKPEDVYELYVSRDGGQTFQKRSELPFDTLGKSYGTMCMLESGSLIVYIYNADDEHNADYVVSDDGGRTWSDVKTAYFAKKLRNPQMASVGGCYFMHGRSGSKAKKGEEKGHMVLYSSRDGRVWDEGVYLKKRTEGLGAYSNSIAVGSLNSHKRNRLLIQASHAYEGNKTSVYHWWVATSEERQSR